MPTLITKYQVRCADWLMLKKWK